MDHLTHVLLQETFQSGRDWLEPRMIMIVLVFSVPIVAIIAHYWHQTIKTRAETELKREMIERGLSADDIERILAARGPESERACRKRSRGETTGKA